MIRSLVPEDCDALDDLVDSISVFNTEEKIIAKEVIAEASLSFNSKIFPPYKILVNLHENKIIGYICYGETPIAQDTYDLYWMATHPFYQGRGIGKELILAIIEDLKERNGRIIRVETSGLSYYAKTREFYIKNNFEECGRIKNFYKEGDDLVIYTYSLL